MLNNPTFGGNLQNILDTEGGIGFFRRLISSAITLLFIMGSVFFFFSLIVGGIRWITSGGDKAQVEGARNQVTHSLIGLVILFSVYVLVSIIQTFFGINILSLDINPLRIR